MASPIDAAPADEAALVARLVARGVDVTYPSATPGFWLLSQGDAAVWAKPIRMGSRCALFVDVNLGLELPDDSACHDLIAMVLGQQVRRETTAPPTSSATDAAVGK